MQEKNLIFENACILLHMVLFRATYIYLKFLRHLEIIRLYAEKFKTYLFVAILHINWRMHISHKSHITNQLWPLPASVVHALTIFMSFSFVVLVNLISLLYIFSNRLIHSSEYNAPITWIPLSLLTSGVCMYFTLCIWCMFNINLNRLPMIHLYQGALDDNIFRSI